MNKYHKQKLHWKHPLADGLTLCLHGNNITNDKKKVTCVICINILEKNENKNSERDR